MIFLVQNSYHYRFKPRTYSDRWNITVVRGLNQQWWHHAYHCWFKPRSGSDSPPVTVGCAITVGWSHEPVVILYHYRFQNNWQWWAGNECQFCNSASISTFNLGWYWYCLIAIGCAPRTSGITLLQDQDGGKPDGGSNNNTNYWTIDLISRSNDWTSKSGRAPVEQQI